MRRKNFTQTQIIALGFLIMIVVGTLLLMCPFSSRSGVPAKPLDAIFTATSASCVTGLITCDTYTQWTLFGQIVIITLIQIGGLGFMTIATLFSFMLRRKISLRERGILQESINGMQIGGILRLVKMILKGTLLFEGAGAALLAVRFVPRFGPAKGLYYSVFHSISAFCNAGFDLMGFYEPYSSLVWFQEDGLVNATLIMLIVVGGIGFLVWQDLLEHRLNWRKYSLHTKIVLSVTAILLFGGAFVFWLLERNALFAELSFSGAFWSSMFASATARTAGFNTIDVAAMSEGSKLWNIMLMVVGGSPGSTAGGIKTTTIAAIFIGVWANIRHEEHMHIFGRRLEEDAVRRASAIITINVTAALVSAILIAALDSVPMIDAMFETFSAIGTVGMTTGITRDLNVLSKAILIVMMYCGRLGSLSFALSFTERKRIAPVQQPAEQIPIG